MKIRANPMIVIIILFALLSNFTPAIAKQGGEVAQQDPARVTTSVELAYKFLDIMMDSYQSGSTLRLIQSYSDESQLGTSAFTYDNAVAIIAYLQSQKPNRIARAVLLGDSLLFAQANDPAYNDGRLRRGYWVAPSQATPDYFVTSAGKANVRDGSGSTTGDMAWAGLALAQLYNRTHDARFLAGAIRLAEWIYTTTSDSRGSGGYNFGVDASNNNLRYKSTEHNIDVYAFFTMLAQLTQNPVWTERATNAANFIAAMYNQINGYYYTGTLDDGATINRTPLPEDVQSWSNLALLDKGQIAALNWVKSNLNITDTAKAPNASFEAPLSFSGVTFSDQSLTPLDPGADPNAVWFEGSAHMALALQPQPDSRNTARFLLRNIQLGQKYLGQHQHAGGKSLPAGYGVVAVSSTLDTGFGSNYYPNLHTGTTAWYLLAATAANPFHFNQRGLKEDRSER